MDQSKAYYCCTTDPFINIVLQSKADFTGDKNMIPGEIYSFIITIIIFFKFQPAF